MRQTITDWTNCVDRVQVSFSAASMSTLFVPFWLQQNATSSTNAPNLQFKRFYAHIFKIFKKILIFRFYFRFQNLLTNMEMKVTRYLMLRNAQLLSNFSLVLNLGSFTLLPQHVVRLVLCRDELKADEFTKFQVVSFFTSKVEYCFILCDYSFRLL